MASGRKARERLRPRPKVGEVYHIKLDRKYRVQVVRVLPKLVRLQWLTSRQKGKVYELGLDFFRRESGWRREETQA